MAFFVYVTGWAMVHKEDCPFCRHGQGTQGAQWRTSYWQGPYRTLEVAQTFALAARRRAYGCGHCLPGMAPMERAA